MNKNVSRKANQFEENKGTVFVLVSPLLTTVNVNNEIKNLNI